MILFLGRKTKYRKALETPYYPMIHLITSQIHRTSGFLDTKEKFSFILSAGFWEISHSKRIVP